MKDGEMHRIDSYEDILKHYDLLSSERLISKKDLDTLRPQLKEGSYKRKIQEKDFEANQRQINNFLHSTINLYFERNMPIILYERKQIEMKYEEEF